MYQIHNTIQQERAADHFAVPQDQSIEEELYKKALKSERSVMTQQPQPTASKEQFNDFKQNFLAHLDNTANKNMLQNPVEVKPSP